MTAAQPRPVRRIDLRAKRTVSEFLEKPGGDGMWVNAGFFVLEPGSWITSRRFDHLGKEAARSARAGRAFAAYRHLGFWQPMDGLRDKVILEDPVELR